MTLAVSILERAGETLGEDLPRFAGALALLVVGLLASALLARIVRGLLARAGVDRLAARLGVDELLFRAGLERSLSRLIAFALRVAMSVAVVIAAISLLGIESLDRSLDEAVLFLPRLLAALGLLLAGAVLGGLARERVDRAAYQMDLPGPLGRLAQVAVLVLFAVIGLAQLGISTGLLDTVIAIVLGGAVATVTLAFGLGGRDVARQVTAGRSLAVSFEVGQTISVEGMRGEIVALEPAAVILREPSGRRLRIPNHVLLETVVVVREADVA